MADCLVIPRPWRLVRAVGWSLGESVGLPVGAYLGVSAMAGPDAGVIAGLLAVWLAVLIRKLASGRIPGLLLIVALMLCVQAVLVLVTGQAWIYLLQFPAAKLILSVVFARSARTADPLVARLATEVTSVRHSEVNSPGLRRFFQRDTCFWAGAFGLLAAGFAVLAATQPVAVCLVICSATTVAVICAGGAVSALWLRAVLRRDGLRLVFAAR